MSDDVAKLANLKSKILSDLQPLVETANIAPEQKFVVMLAAARLSGSTANYESAYNAAQGIEPAESRVDAYLDLLEAIDLEDGDIDLSFDENAPQEATPEPGEQQEQQHQDQQG